MACGVDTPKVHKTGSDDADDQVYGHGVREVFGRIKVVVIKKHSKRAAGKLDDSGNDPGYDGDGEVCNN